jgi:hypothetical protein
MHEAELSGAPSNLRGTTGAHGVPTHVRPSVAEILRPRSGDTSVRVHPTAADGRTPAESVGSAREAATSRAVRPLATTVPSEPVSVGTVTGARAGILGGIVTVDEQLLRLESRLLAEAGGDPAREQALRRHLTTARDRFASATIRQFLPILIERDVRRRLAAG